MGMIQRREDLRFALESRQALGIGGEQIRQDLDGDVAMQPRVAGAIHLPHAARANGRNDFVRPEASTGS